MEAHQHPQQGAYQVSLKGEVKTQLSVRIGSASGPKGNCVSLDIMDARADVHVLRAYFTVAEAGKWLAGMDGVSFEAGVHVGAMNVVGCKHEYTKLYVTLKADEKRHPESAWEAWRDAVQKQGQEQLGPAEGWRVRAPQKTNQYASKGQAFELFADRYVPWVE